MKQEIRDELKGIGLQFAKQDAALNEALERLADIRKKMI